MDTTPSSRPANSTNADIENDLAPGERVLWRGKPERGPFVWRTWPLSIFGAILLSAALTFEILILTTEAPDILAAWGVPFTIAAVYMSGGHFLLTSREWENTEYLVTNSRVLIKHGVWVPRLTTYSLLSLPHTQVEMHDSEVGNVMFKPIHSGGYGPGPGYQTMWPYPHGYLLGLMYVRDPQRVRTLIEGARYH